MMFTNTIIISEEHYKELLEDQRFLECLQAAGVDNWDGFVYAKEEFQASAVTDPHHGGKI